MALLFGYAGETNTGKDVRANLLCQLVKSTTAEQVAENIRSKDCQNEFAK
jgi:hypothetical protein